MRRRPNAEPGEVFLLGGYATTFDPIPSPAYDRLPAAVKEEAEAIHESVTQGGETSIARVEKLVAEHPRVPTFRDLLYHAYLAAGESEKAAATIRCCVEDHPTYIFGICALAKLHLARGEPWEVPAALGHRLDIEEILPRRSTFHASEVLEFTTTLAWYHLRVGELTAARKRFRVLAEIAPYHLATKRLRRYLGRGPIARIRGTLAAWASRAHGRARRKASRVAGAREDASTPRRP